MAEPTMFDKPPVTTMSDHLLRQRRNLLIVCGILWFNKYARVTLPSALDFSGVHLTIGNSDALLITLWIVFAYFLYRYFQYFYTEGLSAFRVVFANALEAKCEPLIRAIVLKEHPDYKAHLPYSRQLLKQHNGYYRFGSIEHTDKLPIAIKRSALTMGWVRAILQTIFIHNAFTDYVFPFILAVSVIFYYRIWDSLFS